jgi:hypothetical protein
LLALLDADSVSVSQLLLLQCSWGRIASSVKLQLQNHYYEARRYQNGERDSQKKKKKKKKRHPHARRAKACSSGEARPRQRPTRRHSHSRRFPGAD